MKKYETLSESELSTVISEYEPLDKISNAYQSEANLEKEFIECLKKQGYEYSDITNLKQLKQNLKNQLEKLNNITFNDREWERFYKSNIANINSNIQDKAKQIQKSPIINFEFENGESINIKLIDKKNIYNNSLQVINQYEANGKYKNRYDISILVNGLPLVHIELKRRGVEIKEAFNQINRYMNESFSTEDKIFEYIQIFVISNGTQTKYYSNTTRESHIRGGNRNTFEFTSYFSDFKNKAILDLLDFATTFFAKYSLLNILSKFCVLNVDNNLLIMRPYQIAATEEILKRINIIHNNKSYGKKANGGYIWHTTGSGKTLTSFKSALLASELEFISKVLFVVDRKDLDYQTMKEYDNFEKDCANSNANTKILQSQLESPDAKIIITTIQKLDKFIKSNKEHKVFDDEIVFIFDECHRSQLGSMHKAIREAFKKNYIFGFTGTPIFPQNCDNTNVTTDQIFGKALHKYTIINAIADKNVLRFRVFYYNTIKTKENIKKEEVRAINTHKALLDDTRIGKIVDYILENFAHITKNNESYTFNKLDNIQSVAKNFKTAKEKRSKISIKGFNTILSCSSIEAVKKYYQIFKSKRHNLKIATIYSYSPNEDFDGLMDENNEGTAGLDQSSRDFLEEAIKDYNAIFNTSYDTSDQKFQNYYKDVSLRMKNKEIDILIVANMFLTGFDARTLNTLWVDKNLKYHGLIQAFSRTNRILNSIKAFGNIVCFRDLEDNLNEALALFGNENSGGVVLLRSYKDYYFGYKEDGREHEGYKSLIQKLLESYVIGERIISEESQKEFIKLFGKILEIRNILECFDEFKNDSLISLRDFQDYQGMYLDLYKEYRRESDLDKTDINDDLIFELELIKQVEIDIDYILKMIVKYAKTEDKEVQDKFKKEIESSINSSLEMRNKKDLIMNFIENINTQSPDVIKDFEEYIDNKRDEEIENIIYTHKLKKQKTYEFITTAFKNNKLEFEGVDFPKILPKQNQSLFNKDSNRKEAKEKISRILREFFERFHAISSASFAKKDEKSL